MPCSQRQQDGTSHRTASGAIQLLVPVSRHLFQAGILHWGLDRPGLEHSSQPSLLGEMHSWLLCSGPLVLFLCCVTSCILVQGISNLGKVLNEASLVSNKTNKTLDSHICCGFRIFGDGFQVIPAWPYTL